MMTTPKEIQSIVNDLVSAKILNADVTLKTAIDTAANSQALVEAIEQSEKSATDGIKPQWYIAGGSSYVLVCPS